MLKYEFCPENVDYNSTESHFKKNKTGSFLLKESSASRYSNSREPLSKYQVINPFEYKNNGDKNRICI